MKKNTRIMIVEDEAIIAMELESSIRSLGYETAAIVNNGDEAIRKAELEKPDLVLMDIRIRGEKDGIEVADVIRKQFIIPVVFSTAYLDEERIERAKITMPFGYLLKPIQFKELKVTIEMALYAAKIEGARIKVEKKLRESENRLSIIYNTTSDYMCLFEVEDDDCYRYISINDAYNRGIKLIKPGIEREQIIGLRVEELAELVGWPGEFIESIKQYYRQAIESQKPVNVVELIPGEDPLYTESTYTAIFDLKGNCTHMLYVGHDITMLKTTENQLRKLIEEKDALLLEYEKKAAEA